MKVHGSVLIGFPSVNPKKPFHQIIYIIIFNKVSVLKSIMSIKLRIVKQVRIEIIYNNQNKMKENRQYFMAV